MPTKPSTTFTFATDANFSSGPANGFPTKIVPGSPTQGFIPGTGINAEWVNYLFHHTGEWITDWLDLGTSSPDVDAHIVETSSGGRVSGASGNFGSTASVEPALYVENNTGAIIDVASFVQNGAGTAVFINSNQISLRARTSDDGFACLDIASAGLNSPGMVIEGGSLNDSQAIQATGGVGATEVIKLTGQGGTGRGIFSDTSAGDGGGALFRVDNSSLHSIIEMDIVGSNPFRGALLFPEQEEPISPTVGDMWKTASLTNVNRGWLEYWDDNGAVGGGGEGKLRLWATPGGAGYFYTASEGDSASTSTTYATKLNLVLDATDEQSSGPGRYIVEMTCQIRPNNASLPRAKVRWRDPASATINEVEINFDQDGQDKPVSFFTEYDWDGISADTFDIQFATQTVGQEVIISKVRLVARGAYDRE